MSRRRRIIPIVALLLVVVIPAAFGATSKTIRKAKATKKVTTTKHVTTAPTTAASTTAAPTTTPTPVSGGVTVFAAASLTASFTEVAEAFEKANPGAEVTLNFAGSATLVTQIQNGAPADVFASADTANMDRLINAKLITGTPAIFTRNKPMIVVPKGNPLRVRGLADLGRPEVFVALGAVGVPAGDYARQILAKAGVTVTPKTLESSVTAIVNKAALKEIDAGIVYVTDVALDDYRVDGIQIPDDQNVTATYPIGTVSSAKNTAAAAAFVAYVQSPAAQANLLKYKFLPLR
jgi:molybdate transport system substrate-binding protein